MATRGHEKTSFREKGGRQREGPDGPPNTEQLSIFMKWKSPLPPPQALFSPSNPLQLHTKHKEGNC